MEGPLEGVTPGELERLCQAKAVLLRRIFKLLVQLIARHDDDGGGGGGHGGGSGNGNGDDDDDDGDTNKR